MILRIEDGEINWVCRTLASRWDCIDIIVKKFFPLQIELNLSCPNLGDKVLPWDSARVFTQKVSRKWCIAKLSPLTTPEQLEFLIDDLGFTQLHFSNTLPWSAKGGLSGCVLRPFTLELIRLVRENWGDSVEIIAGGGVDNFGGAYEYLNEGANHVSLGSVCFNPFKLRKILRSINNDKIELF